MELLTARESAVAWRVLRDPGRPAAENMAADHVLADVVSEGVGVGRGEMVPAILRLYTWARPTVSFASEPAARRELHAAMEAWDAERADRAVIEVYPLGVLPLGRFLGDTRAPQLTKAGFARPAHWV